MSELYISKGINSIRELPNNQCEPPFSLPVINDASYVLLDKCFSVDNSNLYELNDGSLNIIDITSNKAFDTQITHFFSKPNIKNKIIKALISNDASLCCYYVSDINLNLALGNMGKGFTDLYYASIANQTSFFYKVTIVYHFNIARPHSNGGGYTKFSMKLTIFKPDDH